MPETIYASMKPGWHGEAVCTGADDATFFPAEETEKKLDHVRRMFCDLCPVKAKCLNSALINGDHGFWGGTSTSMRNAIRRTRTRAKCPYCHGKQLIETEGAVPYQVCLSCAVSWRSTPATVETVAAS